MNEPTTAQKLEKGFDELSKDIAELLRRHHRVKVDRRDLLEVCKRALPYLDTTHPDGHLVYDAMVDAIGLAEIPIE